MSTRHKYIFTSKPLLEIYSGLDHEGKEVEVREDAEQQVKYHEIVEALAAAGYHRAHMQSLSAFDKIVGGITWCIELCDIDVDINLLFEENLTIGKKIALTEKIVRVLPSLQCPYAIEPHQIQGLDFINIHPLITWLIKHCDEFREAKEDELRRFAVMQYDKDHIFESDRVRFARERQFLRNLTAVQNLYKPCRVRKRKGHLPATPLEQVNAVLAEYDHRAILHTSVNEGEQKDDGLGFLRDIEKTLTDPTNNTTMTDKLEDNNSVDESEMKLHYSVLQSELTGDVSKTLQEQEIQKYKQELLRLREQIESTHKEVTAMRDTHDISLDEGRASIMRKREKLNKLKEILVGDRDISKKGLSEMVTGLETMIDERQELQRVVQHKVSEYSDLQEMLKSLTEGDREEEPLSEEERTRLSERETRMRSAIAEMRREVAASSRRALALAAALDERPASAELLQYERRFVELLEQVAAKHKETKQFYTFHNTLYEVKLYTSKEVSLLNSILDNYHEAMSSSKKREQFMTQLETIVDWVKSTVTKVEAKLQEEKRKKTQLSSEYSQLIDIQRQYAATLKRLADARRKLKMLNQG